jgi:hypothetical protein
LLVTEPDPDPVKVTVSVNGTAAAGRAHTRPRSTRLEVTTSARFMNLSLPSLARSLAPGKILLWLLTSDPVAISIQSKHVGANHRDSARVLRAVT